MRREYDLNYWSLKDLGYLAIRVLAIYVFILGIEYLVSLFQYSMPFYLSLLKSDDHNYMDIVLVTGIPALLLIAISILMWSFADKLSSILAPRQTKGTSDPENVKAWESFVLSAVGMILVILSFSRISLVIMQIIRMESMTPEFAVYNRQEFLFSLTEQFIKFILGLILIFKADGLAYLLRKIRSLGFKQAEAAERNDE